MGIFREIRDVPKWQVAKSIYFFILRVATKVKDEFGHLEKINCTHPWQQYGQGSLTRQEIALKLLEAFNSTGVYRVQ